MTTSRPPALCAFLALANAALATASSWSPIPHCCLRPCQPQVRASGTRRATAPAMSTTNAVSKSLPSSGEGHVRCSWVFVDTRHFLFALPTATVPQICHLAAFGHIVLPLAFGSVLCHAKPASGSGSGLRPRPGPRKSESPIRTSSWHGWWHVAFWRLTTSGVGVAMASVPPLEHLQPLIR